MKSITRSEALAQGYTKCSNRNGGWSYLRNIEDLDDLDFKMHNWWLASKKFKTFQIKSDYVANILSNRIEEDEWEQTGRDDSVIGDAIKSLDFSETTKIINEKLKEFSYHEITQIKLSE